MQDVFGNGGDQLLWVGENFCPVLNLGNITLDIFAGIEVSWEFLDDFSNIHDTLDDIIDVSLLEFSDSLVDLGWESLDITEALLDLLKVILLNESLDETSNEFIDTIDVDSVNWIVKKSIGSDSFDEWCENHLNI